MARTYLRTDFEISVLKIILEYIITLCKTAVVKASINRDMQNNNKTFFSLIYKILTPDVSWNLIL